jgi:hypothetical protein
MKTLKSEQLRYIFLHELAHYKRKDIAINWLMQVLLILHWFNPVLWYAYRRMREDQEIASDALALTRIQSNESNEYGQTIITLLTNLSEQRQIPGMASLSGNKAQLKRRITMIKLFKQNSYRWSILGMFILVLLGSFLLTNGKTSAFTSEPQRALKAFLDSVKEGNVDKAYTYLTATGISESDLRGKFESGFNQEKLFSYKITKFFNDDATHASALITYNFVGKGEQRGASNLIMKDGIWKMNFGNYATPGKIDNLNDGLHRPSLAEIYQRNNEDQNGEVEYAQPSIQPIATAKAIYQKNEKGQTYGSGLDAVSTDTEPDLISAYGVDGTLGYVLSKDLRGLRGDLPKTPEEAVAKQRNAPASRTIPLYDVDGKTVIGEFKISKGEVTLK